MLFRAGAAKAVSKMSSQFATVTDEQILALKEAAVPKNTKKATKFGLAVFTETVIIIFRSDVIT